MDARDYSRELAVALVSPFKDPPVTTLQLKSAIAAELLEKLPISDKLFPALREDVWQLTHNSFVPRRQYQADRLEHVMDDIFDDSPPSVLDSPPDPNQLIWDSYFRRVWVKLVALLDAADKITVHRNMTYLRPELVLFANNRLMVRLEERRTSADMDSALEVLTDWSDNLVPSFIGKTVKWLIGIGAAGNQVKAWAFTKGQAPVELAKADVSNFGGRFQCVKLCINILRAATTLAHLFVSMPIKPYRQAESTYGTLYGIRKTIVVDNNRVRKTVKPWSLHVAESFSKLDFVRKAYEEGCPKSEFLVQGLLKVVKMDRYRVDVSPVGYERFPRDEEEFKDAVKSVLSALVALHQVGLVHRDIRWKKVLYVEGKGWVLIGLEMVWKTGEMPGCWLPGWNDHVLEEDRWTVGGQMLEDGKFTGKSDLCLLGKLFDGFRKPWPHGFQLPEKSVFFQEKLYHKKFANSAEALQTWCDINTWYKPEPVPVPEPPILYPY